MDYYSNLITDKSFKILQDLKRQYEFILIGGWAVFLYTHVLKSKDIDIVIDYDELEKLRRIFTLNKNDRLKKYEIAIDEIEIDLYLPFYSNPGIPAEEIKKYITILEGFSIAKPEILLLLKQKAYLERLGSPKGEKDRIDIVSLLKMGLDFSFYKKILEDYRQGSHLNDLKNLLQNQTEIPELNLNQHHYSKLKKEILTHL